MIGFSGVIAVVVMAAGKGTRMKSDLPKVLHEMAGRPLILHVLAAAAALEPARTVVVVGHGRDLVRQVLGNAGVSVVVQDPPLGTGHAVMQAEGELSGFAGDVVILSGDVPLLTGDSLKRLVEYHRARGAALTVLTGIVGEPFGYGRIVRDRDRAFVRIVEEKDATEEERRICEINSGIYCVERERLFGALHRTKNDNAKGEYYLTDIISILHDDGERVEAVAMADFTEVLGINTPQELREAEVIYLRRQSAAAKS